MTARFDAVLDGQAIVVPADVLEALVGGGRMPARHVRSITEAKKPETRASRVAKAVGAART